MTGNQVFPPLVAAGRDEELFRQEQAVEILSAGSSDEIREANSKKVDGTSQDFSTSIKGEENLPVKRTWVNVAKKHIFTKQKFVVSEIDGQEKVVVPRDVFVGAKPLWEDFLIGKFLNSKIPSLIDVYEVNEFKGEISHQKSGYAATRFKSRNVEYHGCPHDSLQMDPLCRGSTTSNEINPIMGIPQEYTPNDVHGQRLGIPIECSG